MIKVVKGAVIRKRFQKQKSELESAYFGTLERRATLERKKSFNPKQKIESRKYTYESGATYDGEWLGGMRHGNGTMSWADGTRFVGRWSIIWPSALGLIIKPMGVSIRETGPVTSGTAKENTNACQATCTRVSGGMTSSMGMESKFGLAKLSLRGNMCWVRELGGGR